MKCIPKLICFDRLIKLLTEVILRTKKRPTTSRMRKRLYYLVIVEYLDRNIRKFLLMYKEFSKFSVFQLQSQPQLQLQWQPQSQSQSAN